MEKAKCSRCNEEMEYRNFYSRTIFPPTEGTQLVCNKCLESGRTLYRAAMTAKPTHQPASHAVM
ncbi:MAG: hypothetical protein HZA20_07715 [Nitrospirae bacterium]|jgi:late competence protein required for DNA uptake (superfamily II DNA/RNA helicase)|nr:hypothetical protein [Nitrospirota bacterium]